METEAILRSFHRRHAGASERVFGRGRLHDGSTSYEHIADAVLAPGCVLDLACGDGPLARILASRGHEVVGLDMSPEELAIARERSTGNARFVEARADALPFEAASFDAVLTHMALMLFDDLERVVDEIARVLRPGGVFAATVGRHHPPDGALASFYEQVGASSRRDGIDVRFGDPRTRDFDGLRSLFGEPRFAGATHEDVTLEVSVSGEELWSFFQAAFYEVDMLSEQEARALRAWVDDRRDVLAPGGTMSWPFPMRSFRVVRS